MLSTEDVLSSWGFLIQESWISYQNQTWKVFCQMSTPDGTTLCQIHVQLDIGAYVSSVVWCNHLILAKFFFQIDIRFVSDQIDIKQRSHVYDYIWDLFVGYQIWSFARNISLLEILTPPWQTLAPWWRSHCPCHQHGHATIAPTQSRPWHQGHLSTGNCRHQSAEAWSLYVLSALLRFKMISFLCGDSRFRGKKESWQLGTVPQFYKSAQPFPV